MTKEEWGTKRMCPHCGSRFYDLQADPMTCPVCAESFTADSLIAGRGRTLISEKAAAASRSNIGDDDVIEADEDLDANDAEAEIDDDLLEDDDDGDVSLDDIADVPGDEEES